LHKGGSSIRSIKIYTQSIALDAMLKWAGYCRTGGEAKMLIQSSKVKVNGIIETRRSRHLVYGDVIEIPGQDTIVITPVLDDLKDNNED
jgi:ribosome-associated protein